MPNSIHGAKEGYKPTTDHVSIGVEGMELKFVDFTHKLDEEERKTRRLKNDEREKSRARHRKRKGHGRR